MQDMSCSVPVGHAFEHVVDSMDRAFFKDGFCHMASYQKAITTAEYQHKRAQRERKLDRLRMRYGGYTSRFAQELAYNEPLAQALADLFHISKSRAMTHAELARKHPHVAAVHQDCGCHVPLRVALEHTGDHAHKLSRRRMVSNETYGGCKAKIENTCLGGIMACLFCGTHDRHPHGAIKSRGIQLAKSKDEPEVAGEPQEIKTRPTSRETSYLPYPSYRSGSAADPKVSKKAEVEERERAALATPYSGPTHVEELEAIIKRKDDEQKLLELQVKGFQQTEQQLKGEMARLAASDGRVKQLEVEMAAERQASEMQKRKLRDMENANAQHAQQRQQLEQDLANLHQLRQQLEQDLAKLHQLRQQESKEAEEVYASKEKEIEAKHYSRMRSLEMEASQAQKERQSLTSQFEQITGQHERDKAQLRQQCQVEVLQAEQIAEQIRAELEAVKNSTSQIDMSSQERDQLQLQLQQISQHHEQEQARLREYFESELTLSRSDLALKLAQADQIRANLESECNKLAAQLEAGMQQVPSQLQLEQISQRHEQEKAQLRQQFQLELERAEQIRLAFEADCKNLAAQLDVSSKQVSGHLEIIRQHEQEKAALKQKFEIELNQAEQFRTKLEADCTRLASQLELASQQVPGQLQLKQISQHHEHEKTELRQKLTVEFEQATKQISQRHQDEQAELRQKFTVELGQVNQSRAELEAECEKLASQLDSSSPQELEEARIVIQDLQALQGSQEEQILQMSQAIEESRVAILELQKDLDMRDVDLRDVQDKSVTDQQQAAARIRELESALIVATDDANVLRGQLEVANAGSAGLVEALEKSYTTDRDFLDSQDPSVVVESASALMEPAQFWQAVVVERFVADSMDSHALSLEVGSTIQVLSTNGQWATVKTPTGQTGDVPVVCLNMQEQQFADESGIGDSYRVLPQGAALQVSYEQPSYGQIHYEQASSARVPVQSEPHLVLSEPQVFIQEPVLPQTAPIQGARSASNYRVARTSSIAEQHSVGTVAPLPSTRVISAKSAAYEPVKGAQPLTRVSAAKVLPSGAGTSPPGTAKYVGSVPASPPATSTYLGSVQGQPRWR